MADKNIHYDMIRLNSDLNVIMIVMVTKFWKLQRNYLKYQTFLHKSVHL